MRNELIPSYLKKVPKTLFDLCRGQYNFDYDMMSCRCYDMPFKKRWNIITTGYNMLARNPKVPNMPVHIMVELTNYCNLRCPVCPTGTKVLKRKPQNIDVGLYAKFMDDMSDYLLTSSLWGWGESLLHPEFEEILRLSFNRGVNIILSTNGQNLNDEKIINAILRYPPAHLIVALDGITDETLSVYRQGAKLKPALEGVKGIATWRKNGVPKLDMRYIVMSHNEHEYPELSTFARNNKFDNLTIRTLSVIDSEGGIEAHSHLKPKGEKYAAYKYDGAKRVEYDGYICDSALHLPAIFSDGTLLLCCQDYDGQVKYGDLNKSSFKELWFSERAAKMRKVVLSDNKYKFCYNCPFKDRVVVGCTVERFTF